MAVLQEYKCPCCGGGIGFDSSLQKMKCPYCDTEFEMETLLQYDAALHETETPDDIKWETAENEWHTGETEGMRYYVCKSCGGEIIGDESLAATLCPFCGNPVVMMGQYTGDLKPDYVIPFKLDKNAAVEGMKKHLLNKKFLPREFKDENHIKEVKGVYVPYWLFDAEADANVRYRGTKLSTWSDSSYNYTRTSYYAISRNGKVSFAGVPVDGSKKMDDALMQSLEPYDYRDLVSFQTAYLAGYFADRYDVDSGESVTTANERVKRSTERAIAATVQGYGSVTTEQSSISVTNGQARYVLMPVWLLSTKWNGKDYLFAMNGQTGKFVGDLPYDKKSGDRYFWKHFLIIAGCALAAVTIFWLFRRFG